MPRLCKNGAMVACKLKFALLLIFNCQIKPHLVELDQQKTTHNGSFLLIDSVDIYIHLPKSSSVEFFYRMANGIYP